MRIHARHYVTSEPIEIHCDGGAIQAVGSPTEVLPDLQAGWAAPALFDLQINGCGGHSFNSETLALDGVRQVVDACRRHGIASFCPTLITNTQAALIHGFETLAKACDSQADLARAMPCFHLEGPYISDEDGPRGAHPRQHVRPANWEEF